METKSDKSRELTADVLKFGFAGFLSINIGKRLADIKTFILYY